MANLRITIVLAAVFCVVSSKPLEKLQNEGQTTNGEPAHNIQKRFMNTKLGLGELQADGFNHMRVKRSYDDCEKLQLCMLHARSRHSFFAAFELYFVNKENARLWDHRAHSRQDCERRYNCNEK
ncbi:hypothetical protein evm_000989 [Chilo suppressalis]|nr:hypothetical protein evm_000989 [Chilo suppressalis]